MDNVVMSSNVRGCGWLDACGSILHNGRGGQSKAASTYDAAIPSPQILTTERGAVGVAKSPIWEFVPRSRVINFSSACPSFVGHDV